MLPRTAIYRLACLFLLIQSFTVSSESFGRVKFKASEIPLKAETTRSFEVKFRDLLSDEGSGDLSWSVLSTPPSWLDVDVSHETMSGTPDVSHVGTSFFTLTVADKQTGENGGIAKIVVTVNITPRWTESPIQLGKHPENVRFSFDLKNKITFEGSGSLAFSIEDPDGDASWLSPPSNGVISGTPLKEHVGPYEITVTATTPQGVSSKIEAVGEVIEVFCPKWTLNPITIQDAKEDFKYSFDVFGYVENPEGADLSFSLSAGAPTGWVQISDGATLFGTPGMEDIGSVSLTAKVSATIYSIVCNEETTIQFNVIHTNHNPTWDKDPIRISVDEGQALSEDISKYAKDVDPQDSLIFSKVSGPDWAQFSKEGFLTGTPQKEQIGEHPFVIRADDQNGGTADVTVIVKVNDLNDPPYWTENPVVLPDGVSGATYMEKVAPYAKDPEGERLTFERVSGPDWAYVTSSGLIIGTPGDSDQGLNSIQVRAIDPHNAFADATIQINIPVSDNHPPKWTKDPIPFGNIPVDVAFGFDLSPYAYDEDGDKLTFSKIMGPTWLQVSSDGAISGVPQKRDLGDFTAEFVVTDGKARAVVGAYGSVVESNLPPKCKSDPLVFKIYEGGTHQYRLDHPDYVVDPEGDKITFELLTSDDWFGLTNYGLLILAPKQKHVGDHEYKLRVSDDKGASSQCQMLISVLFNHEAPFWIENPIRYETQVNNTFQESIAYKAKDPNGLKLNFSLNAGPAWLTVNSDGSIFGTPRDGNIGENVFTVSVSNGYKSADAKLIITVRSNQEIIDVIQVDEPVPGAKAENMWVVDNSCSSYEQNTLIKDLDDYIDVYFDALESANIHHTGIYLASDFNHFQSPIKDAYREYFLSWRDNNVGNNFRYRMDRSQVREGGNSPIWAVYCFYCRVEQQFSEIYRNFFTENVPMEVMIVSKNKDYYRSYAKYSGKSSWKPSDFAKNFMSFHEREKQPYRINAIARDCPLQMDPNTPPDADNSYDVLTHKTGGNCFPERSLDMEKYLRQYADEVIFRAYVGAKNRIRLSQKPRDPKEIELSIGGEVIPGNTGSSRDIWFYDTYTNEVVIRWHLMDWSRIKPGDFIRIKYKVGLGSSMG